MQVLRSTSHVSSVPFFTEPAGSSLDNFKKEMSTCQYDLGSRRHVFTDAELPLYRQDDLVYQRLNQMSAKKRSALPLLNEPLE